ncbi:MAG: hypothetical protein V3R87_12460 [Dehalococcoidia bacterium]
MTNSDVPAPRKPVRRRRKRVIAIQVLLALGLVLGMWLSFRADSEAPVSVAPAYLGNLALVEQTTGQEALSQMRTLHGTEIGVIDGYIARYEGGGDRVTVWVGQAEDPSAAQGLLELMTEKIAAGNPSFRDLEQMLVDGKGVYSVVGGGERHYYYRDGAIVIWVSVSASDPMQVLRVALETL